MAFGYRTEMDWLKPRESRSADHLDERAVAEFLQAHPDFFERHAALLTELVIPHSTRGRAVSLVERQVVALRDQLTIERKHLKNLVNAAHENSRLQQRLQRVFETIVLTEDLNTLLENLPKLLKSEFDLAAVEIKFLNTVHLPSVPVSHLIAPEDEAVDALRTRLNGRRCLVETPISEEVMALLGQVELARSGSCALLPILGSARDVIGWLVLASANRHHYRHDMDTVLLEGLGGLLSASCIRFGGP